jgi:hypothetical protein
MAVPATGTAVPASGRFRHILGAFGLAAMAALAGCGGSPAQPTPTPAPQPQPPVVTPPAPTPPPAPNTAPAVTGLTAQGTRRREPPNLADAGEEIVLTATVSDAETALDRLTFEWSSPVGTFSGEGPLVRWRAPATVPAPTVATLQVRVVDGEHRVERTVAVRVHDHVREVGDMATLFLKDFSDSAAAPATVMRNFLPDCYGTRDERQQVEDNRAGFTILGSLVGPAAVTVDFDGVCPYNSKPGDACSVSAVRWESRKRNGEVEVVAGEDQVAAVYRQDRWWLCDSSFDGRKISGTGSFYRLLTRSAR